MQLQAKTKLLSAYEPFDSVSLRITPNTQAKLLLAVPPSKLNEWSEGIAEHSVFLLDAHADQLVMALEEAIKTLRSRNDTTHVK